MSAGGSDRARAAGADRPAGRSRRFSLRQVPAFARPFAAARLRTAALAAAAATAVAFLLLARVIAAEGPRVVSGWGVRPAPIPADGGVVGWTSFARSADAVQADGLAAVLALCAGVFAAAVSAALVILLAGWAQHGLAGRRAAAVRRALGEPPRAASGASLRATAALTVAAALPGGVIGWWASAALASPLPAGLTRAGAPPGALVAAAAGAALAFAAALAGVLPTIPRGRRIPAILAVGGRATEDPALGFARRAVASLQVAVLVLAAGTILVLGGSVLAPDRDAWSAFQLGDTVVARVTLDGLEAGEIAALHARLGATLTTATGARAASASSPGTLTGRNARDYVTTYCGFCVFGGLGTDIISVDARRSAVSPGFFRAHGMRLVEGRAFGPADHGGAPRVVLISESYARRFDDGVALGKRVITSSTEPTWATIVGVVPDYPEGGFSLAGDPVPSLYLPSTQASPSAFDVALRLTEAPEPADAVAPELRAALRSAIAAELPAGAGVRVSEVRPLRDLLAEAEAPLGWLALLLAAAAAPALLLAAFGMASGMAEDARARAWEFGIRAALGATPREIGRSVVLRGLAVGGRGLVAGLTLLVAAELTLRDRLPAVRGVDAGIVVTLVLLVALLSLAATVGPALRLAGSDPARALTRRGA